MQFYLKCILSFSSEVFILLFFFYRFVMFSSFTLLYIVYLISWLGWGDNVWVSLCFLIAFEFSDLWFFLLVTERPPQRDVSSNSSSSSSSSSSPADSSPTPVSNQPSKAKHSSEYPLFICCIFGGFSIRIWGPIALAIMILLNDIMCWSCLLMRVIWNTWCA